MAIHPHHSEKSVIWPVIFISWILPLFLFTSVQAPTASESRVYYFAYDSEFFYHGKSLLFGLFIISLIIVLIRRGSWLLLMTRMMAHESVPLVFMAIMVLLSVFFSADIPLSLRGGLRHFEGAGTMLGYLALPVLISLCADKDYCMRILAWSTLPVALIGIFQYYGFNLLNTPFCKALLFLNLEAALNTPDIVHFSGGVGATLGNSNFVGSYCALMVPLTLGYALTDAVRPFSSFRLLPYIGSVALLLASQSSAGLAGAFTAVSILQFTPMIRSTPPVRLAALLAVPLLAVALMTLWHPFMSLQIATAWGAIAFSLLSVMLLSLKVLILKHFSPRAHFALIHCLILTGLLAVTVYLVFLYPGKPQLFDGVTAAADTLTLSKNGETLEFQVNGNQLTVMASAVTARVLVVPATRNFDIHTQKMGTVQVRYTSEPAPARLVLPEYKTSFIIQDSRFMVESLKRTVEFSSPLRINLLNRLESLGSKRIFIWSRTLPLLPQRMLIGSGPDSFAVNYPQHDPLGRINNGIDSRLIIDKAHNMYLQYAINYGIPFVAAFLILITRLGVSCYQKVSSEASSTVQCLFYSAVVGYCTAGIFNDSIPSVAPLFWLMLGLSMKGAIET